MVVINNRVSIIRINKISFLVFYSMSENNKASIIICTYNRLTLLKLCIQSITALKTSPSQFEVVIIDNNSTDGTEDFCKGLSQTYGSYKWKYIRETQQGIAFARTRGVKEAAGILLLILMMIV